MASGAGTLYFYLSINLGAPEAIADFCSTILIGGKSETMTQEWKNIISEANEHLGDRGERVFGFCDLELPVSDFPLGFAFDSETVNFPLRGLRFLGLVLIFLNK